MGEVNGCILVIPVLMCMDTVGRPRALCVLMQDNYPNMDLTLLDLSPYYLLEARKNLKYWADKRAKGETLGGADGTGSSFLQAPAEAIPQPDASFDVVRQPPISTCMHIGTLSTASLRMLHPPAPASEIC